GGHLDRARVARLALLLQETVVHRLQVEGATGKHRRAGEQRQQQQARPPHRQLALEQRIVLEGDARLLHGCGSITSTCPGAGTAMPSRSRAKRSTRACAAQVLCSSCSCPHSTSRSWARACSRSSSENSLRA